MHFLIERIRYVRAWLAWVRSTRQEVAGLEALFTAPEPSECPIPIFNCETCRSVAPRSRASSLYAPEVGRQTVEGDAIKDVVLWLEASGFAGVSRGWLQCYAYWLLKKRAAYEQQGAPA